MSGFVGEVFLDFEIPREVKENVRIPLYERGTNIIVGTGEFDSDGSIRLYVRSDIYPKIMVNSIEDLGTKLSGRSYTLGTVNLEGRKEDGVSVHVF